jgi:CubicO group peptidase (beta-lactamase class C family)
MYTDCKSLSTILPKTSALIAEGIEAGWHFGGQIAVVHHGREVVDAGFGTSLPGEPVHRDDLTLWMSCTKPVSAAAFLLLVDAGQAGLDDPVHRFVPEFAQKGKEGVTVRHLLTHTGGFRSADLGWKPRPWDEAIRQVCEAPLEPRWEPGKSAGYHVDSSWYMLAEIVRRVTGVPFELFIRERLLLPLEHAGLLRGHPARSGFRSWSRGWCGLFNTTRQPPHEHGMIRDPKVAALCRPGGNGRGPARQLARFFEVLLHPDRAAGAQARDAVCPCVGGIARACSTRVSAG